jgi:hypothetical protein
MNSFFSTAFKSVELKIPFPGYHREFLTSYNKDKKNRVIMEELHITAARSLSDSNDFNVDFSIFDHLVGFLLSCKDIKKFAFKIPVRGRFDLLRTLRMYLLIFTKLEELEVSFSMFTNIDELFGIVTECCLKLRKLTIERRFEKNAKKYFRNSNLIIEYLE